MPPSKSPRKWRKNGRIYYRYKEDAKNERRKHERIYYDTKEKAYYKRRPNFQTGTGTGGTFRL